MEKSTLSVAWEKRIPPPCAVKVLPPRSRTVAAVCDANASVPTVVLPASTVVPALPNRTLSVADGLPVSGMAEYPAKPFWFNWPTPKVES